ncbi:magnesium transporter [Falcatimonas sp. MSJ-15]|uniref:magnesium transporter n=1 Tax=Falcatimonas sp. MSJ-15 TaxID=2841515 RepID=UPI00209E28F6|nr:magnesium transporter [Falcatimonas sp. MSJ-15]
MPQKAWMNMRDEIRKIIESGLRDTELREALKKYHENDIAEIFVTLDKDTRIHLYNALGPEMMAEIFAYIEDPSELLEEMGIEKAADVIEQMDADDAVDVLENVDEDVRDQIMSEIEADSKDDINLISSYEDNQIGSRMTTNFIIISQGSTVKMAMRELISQAKDNDNINTIYVKDSNDRYYGAIDLKDLILAREHDDLEKIISTSYPYVMADEIVSDTLDMLRSYEEDSIPVLDDDKHIIGAITMSDIVEAIDDEMGDDYAKLAGLTAEADLKENIFESMKKRLPWLILLLFLGIGVSSVVGVFEKLVSKVALIVCFQSLILDMAGNVGTQSLAVTIRVLMDENISAKEKFGFVLKEMKIGFVNGLLLGTLSFAFIGLFIFFIKGKTFTYAFAISACVGISLIAAMVISSLVGTLIPMFFHKIKVDPAVASGPLITTINDLVAVITYYGLSGMVLLKIFKIA